MTTYGFIGAGNMAGAIVRGAVSAGLTRSKGGAGHQLLVTSAHGSAAQLAEQTGAEHVPQAAEVVRRSDVIILAVKPHVIPGVLEELEQDIAGHNPLVVSVAAGLSLERLESMLPARTRVVRAMPNMAAAVGESMTALAAGSTAGDQDVAVTQELMAAVGRTIVLPETDFSSFIGLAGSSPAFVFTFIDALARAGVLGGIAKEQAVAIVAQAVAGAARTVQVEAQARAAGEGGRTPADLVDAVCSPGGTTVAGVVAMEQAGFSSAVIEAFRATVARDRELGA
ncbi:pyrroline-5-carboxylate reductase [Actinomyces faecalis]|uniref:pyrroline-5-carboxylate reductase n=1 Tax=Actinomyces faecalis TaxID=2722820 RepID=UPI0015539A35|nr:pyrroline-5-carboxylate reductase [Actinomyces faecalis]